MCKDTRYLERRKLETELAKYKVKCRCGHSLVIIKPDKLICSWCGRYVYKNKKLEFKERIKQCLKNTTKNQNQVMYHTNDTVN